VTDGLE